MTFAKIRTYFPLFGKECQIIGGSEFLGSFKTRPSFSTVMQFHTGFFVGGGGGDMSQSYNKTPPFLVYAPPEKF